MSDDINLKITGDSSGGEKALATLERRYDSLEAKLRNMRGTTKATNDDWIAGVQRVSQGVQALSSVSSQLIP